MCQVSQTLAEVRLFVVVMRQGFGWNSLLRSGWGLPLHCRVNKREVRKLILSMYKIKNSNTLQLINFLFFQVFIYKSKNCYLFRDDIARECKIISFIPHFFSLSFLFNFINLFLSVYLFLYLSLLVETYNIQIISLFSFKLIEIKKQTSLWTWNMTFSLWISMKKATNYISTWVFTEHCNDYIELECILVLIDGN
jgi:hypothetical protein